MEHRLSFGVPHDAEQSDVRVTECFDDSIVAAGEHVKSVVLRSAAPAVIAVDCAIDVVESEVVTRCDVSGHSLERLAELVHEQLCAAADAQDRHALVNGALEEDLFGRIPLRRIAAVSGKVIAAAEHDESRPETSPQWRRAFRSVRNWHRQEGTGCKPIKKALVDGIAAFPALLQDVDALADERDLQRRTSTERLAQSIVSSSAAAHLRYNTSPAPITAGRPISLPRIAMCELVPP